MSTKLIAFITKWILKLFYGTNTWDVRGAEHFLVLLQNNKSVIISAWHGQLLGVFMHLSKTGKGYYGLTGTHKDAELITQVGERMGWEFLRGSSKERGKEAFKNIVNTLSSESVLLAITPDGPSGPARIPKPGVIRASQKTNTAVVPVSIHSSRHWTFTNWDAFFLEKPFGKIWIEYGEPIYFDSKQPFEEASQKLIDAMDQIQENNLYYANNSK